MGQRNRGIFISSNRSKNEVIRGSHKNQDLINKIILINAGGVAVAAGVIVGTEGFGAFFAGQYVLASSTLLIAAIMFDPETYHP